MSTTKDYLLIIFRRKGVILLTVCGLMLAVYLGLELKTPRYEAQVTMLIQARKHIESPYYRGLFQSDTITIRATQSEIVKSNPVIERVVRRLHLDKIPADYEKPFASPLKCLVVDIRNKLRASSRRSEAPGGESEISFRKAVEDLKRRVGVTSVRDTNLFSVSVKDYSPQMAAQIANMISRSYSIFDLEQQLAEMKQKYGEKHLFVKQLKDNISQLEAMPPGSIIANIDAIGPASVKVIEQAVPPIKPEGVPRTIILLVSALVSCAAGLVCAYAVDGWDNSFRTPDEVIEHIPLPFLGYIPRTTSVSGLAVKSVRLFIRFVLIFLAILLLLDWVGIWASVDPHNPLVYAARVWTGWLSGVCMFFLPAGGDFYARQYPFFSLVLLAGIGFSTSALLSVWSKRQDKKQLLVEAFRMPKFLLRAYYGVVDELIRTIQSAGVRSVVLCSAQAGAYESFLAANCAGIISQHKRMRVLLIDAQLGSSSLSSLLDISAASGLAEVLTEQRPWKQAVLEVPGGFSFLPSGTQTHRVLSLLGDAAMKRIIAEAEKEYDLVLVASTALSEVQDIRSLAKQTGGVVVTVREGLTRKDTFQAQVEALEKKSVRFLGVILSDRRLVIPRIIYDRA
ncbi:MAG: hypothetical protein MJA29_03025 [Candidatus Omnitrophica bacterium]|nr:hypothetical protein [Candidatus Omnitrophota bacterium]